MIGAAWGVIFGQLAFFCGKTIIENFILSYDFF